MEEDKIIDQSALAEDVSSKIEYTFIDRFLVKPLDVVKVKKTFTKPVSDKKPVVDENGIEAVDYDTVETEVKEVDSELRKGVVLKVPESYTAQMNSNEATTMKNISVGDVVVFFDRVAVPFDLLKDSKMIRYWDVIAVVK